MRVKPLNALALATVLSATLLSSQAYAGNYWQDSSIWSNNKDWSNNNQNWYTDKNKDWNYNKDKQPCAEVPEPGTLGLMGVGAVALLLSVRRRSRS